MGDRIHFGTLKLQDRDKIAATRSNVVPQVSVLGESAQRNIAQREAVMQQIEQERLARSIAVPTNDIHVKLKLRELGRPICLFGEGSNFHQHKKFF
jgi:U4/U6 small nuclear ribonucleoprotein PRP4